MSFYIIFFCFLLLQDDDMTDMGDGTDADDWTQVSDFCLLLHLSSVSLFLSNKGLNTSADTGLGLYPPPPPTGMLCQCVCICMCVCVCV